MEKKITVCIGSIAEMNGCVKPQDTEWTKTVSEWILVGPKLLMNHLKIGITVSWLNASAYQSG